MQKEREMKRKTVSVWLGSMVMLMTFSACFHMIPAVEKAEVRYIQPGFQGATPYYFLSANIAVCKHCKLAGILVHDSLVTPTKKGDTYEWAIPVKNSRKVINP